MVEWMISSSVLIVLVMAMRYFFRGKLAMRARYALWLVVAVRLLVPVSFAESGLSVLNLFALEESGEGQEAGQGEPGQAGGAMQNGPRMESGQEAGQGEPGQATGALQNGPGMEPGMAEGQDESGLAAGLGKRSETGLDTEQSNKNTGSDRFGEPQGRVEAVAEAERPNGSREAGLAGKAGTVDGTGHTTTGISSNVPPDQDRKPETQLMPSGTDTWSLGAESDAEGGTGAGTRVSGVFSMARSFLGRHSFLRYIWLLGVALSGCCVLICNGRYRKRVRISRKRYKEAAESRLPVYVSPVVDSPCMFGLIRPAVYLNREAAQKPEALRYVLCHENIHYRHRDNLWVAVRAACLCLHWYNPLVWIAAALSEQDGELACDEKTMELLGEEERIHYGRALLDFCAQGSLWQRGWKLSTAMSSGKKLLKERLLVIVAEPERHAGALAAVMFLTALCAAATFTGRVSGRESGEDAALADREETAFDATGSGNTGNPAAEGVESTAIVPIDLGEGDGHILKISGQSVPGSGQYRIDRIALTRVQDRREETLQTIRPEDVRVLYTRSLEDIRGGAGQMYSFTSEEEPLYAKPLVTEEDLPAHEVEKFLADGNGQIFSGAPDGGILVADLNFDGYQDFCLQGGRGTAGNVPYYCYLWNPAEGRFQPGYMIPNVEVDREAQLVKSATDDGNGVGSETYYRFDQSNVLHMVRYVEEDQSPDAVFPTLDLTYCETDYGLPAVDEWDYGTRYGGALTERFVFWAKQALTELYEWSGTKIDKACFTVSRFGDFAFANTPEELNASLIYYDRSFGEKAGFESSIGQMGIATERTVWFSPVIQWNRPEGLDGMTDHELVEWYFQRAPLAEGEKLASVEGVDSDRYNILTESGNFYQIYLNEATREISAMYGPYEERPD